MDKIAVAGLIVVTAGLGYLALSGQGAGASGGAGSPSGGGISGDSENSNDTNPPNTNGLNYVTSPTNQPTGENSSVSNFGKVVTMESVSQARDFMPVNLPLSNGVNVGYGQYSQSEGVYIAPSGLGYSTNNPNALASQLSKTSSTKGSVNPSVFDVIAKQALAKTATPEALPMSVGITKQPTAFEAVAQKVLNPQPVSTMSVQSPTTTRNSGSGASQNTPKVAEVRSVSNNIKTTSATARNIGGIGKSKITIKKR